MVLLSVTFETFVKVNLIYFPSMQYFPHDPASFSKYLIKDMLNAQNITSMWFIYLDT